MKAVFSFFKITKQVGILLFLCSCSSNSYLGTGEGDFLQQQEDKEKLKADEDFISFKSDAKRNVRVGIVVFSKNQKLIKKSELLVLYFPGLTWSGSAINLNSFFLEKTRQSLSLL